MTDQIRAPWTPDQVAALNAFQRRGGMHPFTCGGEHAPGSPTLVAYADGWRCPQPYGEHCGYRQDWAHAFMADPNAWPKVHPIRQYPDERREQAETDMLAVMPAAQATLTVTVTAPDPVHAVRWAGYVRDLVHAEHDGSMRLHSFIELEAGGAASCSPAVPETEPNNPAATEATDVGTEFVQQADHPDGEALDLWETDLAQTGVDTPGCDCGHEGMGVSWHGDDCPWRCGVLEGTVTPDNRADKNGPTIGNPQASSSDRVDNPADNEAATDGLREQLHAAIESEVYEYRERTMFWPETGGVTQEIARLATRGAMEVRDAEVEQLRATLAAITAEAARRGVISIDGIRKIVKEQQP